MGRATTNLRFEPKAGPTSFPHSDSPTRNGRIVLVFRKNSLSITAHQQPGSALTHGCPLSVISEAVKKSVRGCFPQRPSRLSRRRGAAGNPGPLIADRPICHRSPSPGGTTFLDLDQCPSMIKIGRGRMAYSDGKEEALSERLEQKGDQRLWHGVGGQDGASARGAFHQPVPASPAGRPSRWHPRGAVTSRRSGRTR